MPMALLEKMIHWLRRWRDPWSTEGGLRTAAIIAATQLFTSFVDETPAPSRASRVLAEDYADKSLEELGRCWQVAPEVALWISTARVAGDLPVSLRSRFESRWRLYREAACLMALLRRETHEPRYFEFVKEYERRILPATTTPQADAKVSALRDVMGQLQSLINGGGAPKSDGRYIGLNENLAAASAKAT